MPKGKLLRITNCHFIVLTKLGIYSSIELYAVKITLRTAEVSINKRLAQKV